MDQGSLSLPRAPQAAREVVAERLRALRRTAGLTVTELARRCGWHHSKTSRIENGRSRPSATDIQLWCRACGADEEADDLVARSLQAESMYAEWRHQIRQGLTGLQRDACALFAETRLFRVYSSTVVPGLLQTGDYAAGILAMSARNHHLTADDSLRAARARVIRSEVLRKAGRRSVFVVEEAVLHHTVCEPEGMAAQLEDLLATGSLPGVSFGVVPAGRRRVEWPRETFHVYDDRLVSVEMMSARLHMTQRAEVGRYLDLFERLRRMAVYGGEARSLIRRALRRLDTAPHT